jgi:hypothetical protein
MGIIAQGDVRVAREMHLSAYTKDHSINVADDFNGFCDSETIDGNIYDDWEGLADSFIDTLKMCEAMNWSMKASKIFLVSQRANFLVIF